jgi:hypothetical protein
MVYGFVVLSKVKARVDFEKGISEILGCDVELVAKEDIERNWRDKEGVVNEYGVKVQTQGLIQGLIANIHWAHQNEKWDSAEHLRYVIENLERGFVQSGVKTKTGGIVSSQSGPSMQNDSNEKPK